MQARTPALHLGPRRPRLHIPCWLPPSFPPCACTAPAPTEPLLLWLPLAQQTWLSDVAEKQRKAAKSDDAQGRDAACREGDPCPIAGGSGIFLRLQSNASYCCLSPNLVAAPLCPAAWPGGARRQLSHLAAGCQDRGLKLRVTNVPFCPQKGMSRLALAPHVERSKSSHPGASPWLLCSPRLKIIPEFPFPAAGSRRKSLPRASPAP